MSVAPVDPSDSPFAPAIHPALPPLPHRRKFEYRKNSQIVRPARDVTSESFGSRTKTQRIVSDGTFRTLMMEYDHKIEKTVRGVPGVHEEHVEDIKQEIYLKIAKRDPVTGKNGLEAYDPARGAFTSYLYRLVHLHARNYRNKMGRDRLTLKPFDVDLDLAHRNLDLGDAGEDDRNEFYLQIAAIAEDLEASSDDSKTRFDRSGRLVACDERTVMELLLDGRSRKEIQQILDCTSAELSAIVDSLAQDERLKELARAYDVPTVFVATTSVGTATIALAEVRLIPPIGELLETRKQLLEQAERLVEKKQALAQAQADRELAEAEFNRMFDAAVASTNGHSNGADEPAKDNALTRIVAIFKAAPKRSFTTEEVVADMLEKGTAEATTKTYLTRLAKKGTLEKIDAKTWRLAAG